MGNSHASAKARHEKALRQIPRVVPSELRLGDLVLVYFPVKAMYGMPMHANIVRGVATADIGNSFTMERRDVPLWTMVLLVGQSIASGNRFLLTGTANGITCIENVEDFVRTSVDRDATIAVRRARLPSVDRLAQETSWVLDQQRRTPRAFEFASVRDSPRESASEDEQRAREAASSVLRHVKEYLAYPTTEMMVEIFRAFAQADRDGNGRIDRLEVADVLRSLHGREVSDDEVRRFMEAVDANADGRITKREFIEAARFTMPRELGKQRDLDSTVSGQVVALVLERAGVLIDLPPMSPAELFDDRKVDMHEAGEEEEEEEGGEEGKRPDGAAPRGLGRRGSSRRGAVESLRRALGGRARDQPHDWMRSLRRPDDGRRPLYDAASFASNAERRLPVRSPDATWGPELVVIPEERFEPWMAGVRVRAALPLLPRDMATALREDPEGRLAAQLTRGRSEEEREQLIALAASAQPAADRRRVAPLA